MSKVLDIRVEDLGDGAGFWVDSQAMPELNLHIREEKNLPDAVAAALRYLFKHNGPFEPS